MVEINRGRREKIGYSVNPGKSCLIWKDKYKYEAIKIFQNSHIKIKGHLHLGSVIGNKQSNKNYISSLFARWCEEIIKLSETEETHPQAAYWAFTFECKCKFLFFIRIIKSISIFLSPVKKVIKKKLYELKYQMNWKFC